MSATVSYDSAWKELLDRFLDLVLMLLFPDVWATLDWSKGYESLDPALRKFVPAGESGDRLADKLVRATTKKRKGKRDPQLLHFEVQGQRRHGFGLRVYQYNYRGFDALGLPPEALVILADDDPDWRPRVYEVELVRTTLAFAFRPVKLIDLRPRLEELRHHENPVGLFVVAHLESMRTAKDDAERSRVKLGLLLDLAARKMDEDDTRQWYRFLDWLLPLPEEADRAVYLEAGRILKEKQVPFVTFADRYEREQGQIAGKIEGLLRGLELGMELKFGAEGAALMPLVRRIADPARLDALVDRVKTAATLADVRQTLAEGD